MVNTSQTTVSKSQVNNPQIQALYQACINKDLNKIDELIKQQWQINRTRYINAVLDKEGNTALHLACTQGHEEMVEFLVRVGGNLKKTNKYHYDPLHTALYHRQEKLACHLIETYPNKINFTLKGEYGRTLFHTAVFHDYIEVIRLLLTHIPKRNRLSLINAKTTDSQTSTALHTAARHGFDEIAALLLTNNVDVNAVNSLGETALVEAVIHNKFLVIREFYNRSIYLTKADLIKIANKNSKEQLNVLQSQTQPNLKDIQSVVGMYNQAFDLQVAEATKALLTTQLSLLSMDDFISCFDTLIELLVQRARDSLAQNNFCLSIESVEEGINAMIEGKLDPFVATVLGKSTTDLSIPLKLVYSRFNNITVHQKFKDWGKYLPESYRFHMEDVSLQLKSYLLSTAAGHISQQQSDAIKMKLDFLWLVGDAKRNAVFADVYEFLKQAIKQNDIGWVNNQLNLRLAAVEMRALIQRVKALLERDFPEDNKIYLENAQRRLRQSLYSKPPVTAKLEQALQSRLIGQSHAVKMVADKLSNISQAKKQSKPTVFIFYGPTGVGKTEMAQAMASAGFQNMKTVGPADRLIKFSMEKYSEKHSVSAFFGAPTGYVGSQDKPNLAKALDPFVVSQESGSDNKVVKNIVLLLDEFEKAADEIKQACLTLFDEGKVTVHYTEGTKNCQETYLIQNSFIVATSNLFSTEITQLFNEKQSVEQINNEFNRLVGKSRALSPELLGRFQPIPFGPLKQGQEFQQLVRLKLQAVCKKEQLNRGLKGIVIDKESEKLVLEALENELYTGGTNLRAVARYLENEFSKLFANQSFAEPSDWIISLQYDVETKRVIFVFKVDDGITTFSYKEDASGQKRFLTQAALIQDSDEKSNQNLEQAIPKISPYANLLLLPRVQKNEKTTDDKQLPKVPKPTL